MTKYYVRMGKQAGIAYLSLGILVNHKYNYSVTDPHINDISRHFTPKLIKYLRTLLERMEASLKNKVCAYLINIRQYFSSLTREIGQIPSNL